MMATARPAATLPTSHHPCPRCGIIREARPTSLCRDCKDALTRDELQVWRAAA